MTPEKTSATIGYLGSGAAILFGLTAQELAALGGLAVAVVGFTINVLITLHYKQKHYELIRAEMQQQRITDHARMPCEVCPLVKTGGEAQ